ncbi:MAG: hypothetical protein Q9187_002579 [Circinaria calcarea]
MEGMEGTLEERRREDNHNKQQMILRTSHAPVNNLDSLTDEKDYKIWFTQTFGRPARSSEDALWYCHTRKMPVTSLLSSWAHYALRSIFYQRWLGEQSPELLVIGESVFWAVLYELTPDQIRFLGSAGWAYRHFPPYSLPNFAFAFAVDNDAWVTAFEGLLWIFNLSIRDERAMIVATEALVRWKMLLRRCEEHFLEITAKGKVEKGKTEKKKAEKEKAEKEKAKRRRPRRHLLELEPSVN